ENVENEALLDGLAHGIEAEWRVGAIWLRRAEEFQRLGFWRCREGEEAHIGQPAPALHLCGDTVLVVLLVAAILLLCLLEPSRAQYRLEVLGALTRLG